MQGRSLIRTIDISVVVGVGVLMLVLGVFNWMSRVVDSQTRSSDAMLVHSALENEVARFIDSFALSGLRPDLWVNADPQERAFVSTSVDIVSQSGGRIAALLARPETKERLQRVSANLKQLDATSRSAEFVLLGGRGDATIALMAQWPDTETAGFAIEVLDLQQIATRLDRFGITLAPASTPESATNSDGQTIVTSRVGDVVAVVPWTGRRVADFVHQSIQPTLLAILIVGIFALLVVRHSWRSAQARFLSELDEVHQLASTDPLSGLPNRRALFEHLAARLPLGEDKPTFTLLLLDLDAFKWVNDTLGHRVGDDVIQKAAKSFQTTVGDKGFVARLGGDEFVIVLPQSCDDAALNDWHTRLSLDLGQVLLSDARLGRIGLSIGAVHASTSDQDGDDLIRLADMALYVAKGRGRGRIVRFEASMADEATFRRSLERDMRAGLAAGQFLLHHQPIVDAMSGEVRGYESLVRWNHPERGLVSPGEFIPVAENSDLIIDLGAFVLEQALKELGPLSPAYISVNVTGRQLHDPAFVGLVSDLLKKYQVEAKRLCLELTETSLISDGPSVAEAMDSLRAIGVRFAIDDFGAGYASLGYLLKFRFDILKIDRDFIAALDDKPESSMIVMSVVSLARSLGMQVVGEGVETPAQHRFLASAGCVALQGYLFGRPAPVSAVLSSQTTPKDRAQEIQAA